MNYRQKMNLHCLAMLLCTLALLFAVIELSGCAPALTAPQKHRTTLSDYRTLNAHQMSDRVIVRSRDMLDSALNAWAEDRLEDGILFFLLSADTLKALSTTHSWSSAALTEEWLRLLEAALDVYKHDETALYRISKALMTSASVRF